MSLPKWMEELKIGNNAGLAYEALTIAVEALSVLKNSVTGVYYLGEEKEIEIISEALRRIEELGR